MSVIIFSLLFKFSDTPSLSGLVTDLLHNIFLIFAIFFGWVVFIFDYTLTIYQSYIIRHNCTFAHSKRFYEIQKKFICLDTALRYFIHVNVNACFSGFLTFVPMFFLKAVLLSVDSSREKLYLSLILI